jgi:hypothetical protein
MFQLAQIVVVVPVARHKRFDFFPAFYRILIKCDVILYGVCDLIRSQGILRARFLTDRMNFWIQTVPENTWEVCVAP